jgi:hypothetical protein
MNDFLLQVFFLATLVSGVAFFGYQLPMIKKEKGKRFHFLNEFPYEFLSSRLSMHDSISDILLGWTVLMPTLYVVIQTQLIGGMNRWVILFLITIMTLSRAALFYIHPSRLRLFLLNTTIHFTSSTMFYGFMVMITNGDDGLFKRLLIFIFFLTHLFVLFHPKLMNWSVLEKEDKEKPSYVRPKLFILAFLQWFFIFGIVGYVVLQHLMTFI